MMTNVLSISLYVCCLLPTHVVCERLSVMQSLWRKNVVTRKHSSRMCTSCMETIRASVTGLKFLSPPWVFHRCHFWGSPQMNKFEQVFSDDQQMSLAACRAGAGGGGGGRQTHIKNITLLQLHWRAVKTSLNNGVFCGILMEDLETSDLTNTEYCPHRTPISKPNFLPLAHF